ncbi:unnamed protein product [Ostreobium quekettii]|uniref:Uncharacterized protein n=1 Tax=Ostreobium quekettii TaxID=121088 RepID=A0A8S1JB76_9CHLO|nr:unnamed protein product [Ostreobium quekettii]
MAEGERRDMVVWGYGAWPAERFGYLVKAMGALLTWVSAGLFSFILVSYTWIGRRCAHVHLFPCASGFPTMLYGRDLQRQCPLRPGSTWTPGSQERVASWCRYMIALARDAGTSMGP